VVDQRLLPLQVVRTEAALGGEHLLVHPDEVVDRGSHRLVALGSLGRRIDRGCPTARDHQRHHDRRDQCGNDDESEHHHQGFHRAQTLLFGYDTSTVNRGYDTYGDGPLPRRPRPRKPARYHDA
jgi:hypothetical protein